MAPAGHLVGHRAHGGHGHAGEHDPLVVEVRAVDTRSPVTMTALKILSLIGKIAGLVTALETIPYLDPQTGVLIFAAASLLKDTANRIGDLVDDGRVNRSFKS